MAAFQSTGVPSISLPNGARSLPVELLPSLEKFKKIYLWMDDDLAGMEGAQQFARKLGVGRCFLVKAHGAKDANEALLRGVNMRACLAEAEPLPHEQITSFRELRAEVRKEFADPVVRRGVQSTSLPMLNNIIKGHRRGELSIWTGPTGVGKTTVLSQISLDYCAQGVNTLWGSFEIKNTRLARTMLLQYAGEDFSKQLESFDGWADKFQTLPMYFLRFFGSTDIDQVLDAMDYAAYVHDVEHVVLDNLQFMLSGQNKGGYDKFDAQDRALSKLRQFATSKNVHVTLVIHPRKEADRSSLGVSSIFGSAKATQEADNVYIIQAHEGGGIGPDEGSDDIRLLELKKNRFDGELGVVPFRFEKSTNRIVELDEPDEFLRRRKALSYGSSYGGGASYGSYGERAQRGSYPNNNPPPGAGAGKRPRASPQQAQLQQEVQQQQQQQGGGGVRAPRSSSPQHSQRPSINVLVE
jgi:twinkle protein